MKFTKILLSGVLFLTTYSMQALSVSDVVRAACVFVGFKNPVEMIDGIEHQAMYSYQAQALLQKTKNKSQQSIEYKTFKTAGGLITTQHIVDGYTFTSDDAVYVVRSGLCNSEKIYKTEQTLFGSTQIVVDGSEALAIMNDTKYLKFVNIQLTPSLPTRMGKYNGYLADGSSFTAHGIHYVVRIARS